MTQCQDPRVIREKLQYRSLAACSLTTNIRTSAVSQQQFLNNETRFNGFAAFSASRPALRHSLR